MAVWDPARDGSGGFGDTPTFASPPSLYYTAWSVRLADAANIRLTNLDKTMAAKALIASALSSNTDAESARIPLVERLYLVTKMLQVLHLSVPNTFVKTLAALRSGARYRGDRATRTTSWPATYLAVKTLAAVGSPLPQGVIDGARLSLPAATVVDTPQTIMSLGIPVLGTLGATPGLLPKLVPNIAVVLSSFTKVLLEAGGVSAVAAAGLVSVAEIAAAAGVSLPSVPSSFVIQLLTPSGYYAFGQGHSHGDPQATFYAVRLGMNLSDAARATLLFGHIKQGWLSTLSATSLSSSFQAAVAARACQIPLPHTVAFGNRILAWLQDAATQPRPKGAVQTPGGMTRSTALSAAEACWLAKAYGLTITEVQHAALTDNVSRAATQASTNTAGIAEGGEVASAVEQCHLTLSASARTALVTHLAMTTAITAEDALSLHIASEALAAPGLDTRARETASLLKTPTGLFRFQPNAGVPDLISTAYGYAVSGGSHYDRMRAAGNFNTPWGPGLATAASTGSASPIVDLASLAAGLSLITAGNDTPLLF